ncbi:MAG: prolipoprotein diacylglyceryl transferase [Pseudomonadota bacterium]
MIPFPDIDPVAIAVGPLQIRWYALAYLCGFLLAWAYAIYITKLDPDKRPNKDDIDDFLPWVVVGVILGGRLGYTIFYQPSVYLADPLAILKVWEGGMSFHGGALGVIAALFIYSWRHKIQLLRLSDTVCATVPIGLFLGRIANFINGELFGRAAPADLPWAVVFPRGGEIARHPSQIYEAILEGLVLFIVLFVLIKMQKTRNMPGIVTGVFLAGYGLARFFVEYYREPDFHIGLIADAVSMGQILSVPMILLGTGVCVYAVRMRAKTLT